MPELAPVTNARFPSNFISIAACRQAHTAHSQVSAGAMLDNPAASPDIRSGRESG
jgi:hypothetical protein